MFQAEHYKRSCTARIKPRTASIRRPWSTTAPSTKPFLPSSRLTSRWTTPNPSAWSTTLLPSVELTGKLLDSHWGVALHNIMLCYILLCCVIVWYVVLQYVMLCYIMLCCVTLCYVVLHYVMLS